MKPFGMRLVAYWKGWKKAGLCCPNCGRDPNRPLLRTRYKCQGDYYCIKCGGQFVLGMAANLSSQGPNRSELLDITHLRSAPRKYG